MVLAGGGEASTRTAVAAAPDSNNYKHTGAANAAETTKTTNDAKPKANSEDRTNDMQSHTQHRHNQPTLHNNPNHTPNHIMPSDTAPR